MIENEEKTKQKAVKEKKIRTMAGISFLTLGFLLMGIGIIVFIGDDINFNLFLFFEILSLSLGVMIVGSLLVRSFLKKLVGFILAFVIIIAMISTLLPICLSFSENNTIKLVFEIIFKVIYCSILIAFLVRLIKISFGNNVPATPLAKEEEKTMLNVIYL